MAKESNHSIVKITLLIAVIGGLIGGYRAFSGAQTGNLNSMWQNATSRVNRDSAHTISIQSSGTYQSFVTKIAEDWMKQHPEIKVNVLPSKESRDTLHYLIEKNKAAQFEEIPDLWLASSDSLVQSLHSATKTVSSTFANVNDTRTYSVWPPQPLVALCKVGVRDRVQQAFSGKTPLASLDGGLKYSFPDPLVSSGGQTAIAYCNWEYSKQSQKNGFGPFLTTLAERGYVPLAAPSGGLASDFARSQLDFILTYNALADREVDSNPGQLAKIVPQMTVWERPSTIALRPATGWSSEKEKTLMSFIEFIRQHPPYSGSGSNQEIEVPAKLDTQKRIWEETFDQGARLSNINSQANLPVHPR